VRALLERVRPLHISLVIGVLTALYTFFHYARSDWFLETLPHKAELKVLDSKFLVRGRIDIEPAVVIAAGDEKSVARFGLWGSWDRAVMGRVIHKLIAAGADVVAFDMVFADPPGIGHEHAARIRAALLGDEPLSARAGDDLATLKEGIVQLEALVTEALSGDRVLAEALDQHSSRVVQGFIANETSEPGQPPSDPADTWDALEVCRWTDWGYGWRVTEFDGGAGLEKTVATLEAVAAGKPSDLHTVREAQGHVVLPRPAFLEVGENLGFYSINPDPDGTLRRVPLVLRHGEQFLTSLALSGAALHYGATPALLADGDMVGGLRAIGLAAEEGRTLELPVDLDGTMLVNYYGPSKERSEFDARDDRGTFPRVSLADVHDGTFDPELVRGKVVLVAVTAMGTYDQRVTPFSPNVPGVEVHAAALQNLIAGDALTRRPQVVWLEMLLSVLLAVGFGVALHRLGIWAGTLVALAAAITWIGADYLWLFRNALWFHQVPMLAQIGSTWAAVTLWGYFAEGREKALLKREFSTVLSPTVVDELLKNPALAGLGGAERELTVMFSDIRGFTSISETLSPEGLTQFLNEYLTPMTDILIQRQGTLDKYMGDAIMAFWGAPILQADHAARACLAALDMLESLRELRLRWKGEGKPDIDVGIGLNSGLMRVGFMGSARMRNYTLLGDNVNLGSRLEGVNKQYGTNIIVSQATYEAARHVVYARELDAIRVKGKREPVIIFELRGKGSPDGAEARLLDTFDEALSLYQERRFAEARARFEVALSLFPQDEPSRLYIERCEAFARVPPPAGWDGVFEMTTK
jgi:adenylate cyclase